MSDKLADFYKEGVKNPTIARLVSKQAISDGTARYGEYLQEDIHFLRGKPIDLLKEYVRRLFVAISNIKEAEQKAPVKKFYNKFYEKLKQLYPQTHIIREKLIQDQRVCLNEIKPCLPKGIKKTLKYSKYI
jgi:hypothetical protein